jgi:hypothetical protein
MVPLNPPVTMVCAGNTKGKQSISKQQKRTVINKFFLIKSPIFIRIKLNGSPPGLCQHITTRQPATPYNVISRRNAACRGLNSMTMPRVDNIRARETQKHQNRQYADEQKRDHERLPSSPLLITCIAFDRTL